MVYFLWPGGVMVRAFDLQLVFESLLFHFQVTTLGMLSTRASVTKQYNLEPVRTVMPCVLEGNHRSGIALAMHHRLQWFIHLRVHGLRKEDTLLIW